MVAQTLLLIDSDSWHRTVPSVCLNPWMMKYRRSTKSLGHENKMLAGGLVTSRLCFFYSM
jgi:hypothetical protein